MKALIPALPLLLLPAGDLTIDYTAERSLEVSIETEVTSETTNASMEIDGEPVDRGNRFGGGGSEYSREVVFTETVLEHDEGAPTKVKRAFDTVEGVRTIAMGEESRDFDIESPMDGVTLVLSLEDDEVVAEVEDDGDAERSEMLEGHSVTNLLHGLLPGSDEDSWEPSDEAIAAVLLLDVERALFPPPQFDEGDGGERGRGRGRGMRGGGGSPFGFLREAEWDAEAELSDRTEEVDGVECAVIELVLEAEGDMPERSFGGRGGRGGSLGSASVEVLVENTFEIELTGALYFSVEERRPVQLELEGEFIQDTLTERDTERGSFRMERTQEGTIEHTITITSEDA